MLKRILSIVALFCWISAQPVLAQEVEVNPNHPDEYVVVPGDTLWDISGMFLNTPWLWPEIWHVNPQIENPHLIYPGDVISLTYINGKPVLRLSRGGGLEKLSPSIRSTSLAQAIPTIPMDKIQQFLTNAGVIDEEQYEKAPYIVSTELERLISAAGDRIYVRRYIEEDGKRYVVVRKGKEYVNPADGIGVGSGKAGESLGYEAIEIADSQITRGGDPATGMITRSNREAIVGDRLLPYAEEEISHNFFPRAPETDMTGSIVGVVDGVTNIGQFNVVAVNMGEVDGIQQGHVFDILAKGPEIVDPVISSDTGFADKKVRLPDEKAGRLMVFRSFERISYALVMEAYQAIHVGDLIKSPR